MITLFILHFNISVRAARASHTRLRQLADFPSLILRSTFAQPSLKVCDDEVMGDCRVLYF
ncbi:hypothetical protein HMPREF9075_00770 [Capnocytophaga sp. oral taxon 332 str. F0381]|nr:hypothetical protein HMPREF9075_00770 [Capnocytophaga sp. oral taxon 332 str. F0381]